MGLFKPAWLSKNVTKRLKGVAKLDDQTILADLAVNDSDLRVNTAAVKKLTDQNLLAQVLRSSQNFSVRKEAIDKLTDSAALLDAIKAIPPVPKNKFILDIATNRLLQLKDCDEQQWLDLCNYLSVFTLANYDDKKLTQGMLSQINSPAVLLLYRPTTHCGERNALFLSRVIELAGDDRAILRRFQARAADLIKTTHTDTVRQTGGVHQDHKQLVPGNSSDCHNDTISWKPAMTAFGHGYHQDGYTNTENHHEDTYPLMARFQPYFDD